MKEIQKGNTYWGEWDWHPTFRTLSAVLAYVEQYYPTEPHEIEETGEGNYRIRIGLVKEVTA